MSGGTASGPCDVRDFTPHRIMRTKALSRVPRYFCVRLSWDAEHVHQLCDPNDPNSNNRTTGIVRGATVEFWNDMRRAQYVDPATRMLEVRIPISSNPAGVRSTARLMFEFTSTGGLLPSYETMTRVAKDSLLDDLEFLVLIGAAFCIYFGAMEFFEIISIGITRYAAATPHLPAPAPSVTLPLLQRSALPMPEAPPRYRRFTVTSRICGTVWTGRFTASTSLSSSDRRAT